jgi:hypothetical protein
VSRSSVSSAFSSRMRSSNTSGVSKATSTAISLTARGLQVQEGRMRSQQSGDVEVYTTERLALWAQHRKGGSWLAVQQDGVLLRTAGVRAGGCVCA